jgi:ribonuclease R
MEDKILEIYKSKDKKRYSIGELVSITNLSYEEVRKIMKLLIQKNLIYKSHKKYCLNTYFPSVEEKENIKLKILDLLKEKKIVTFRNIIMSLEFKNSAKVIFLRELLKELENNKEIYHSSCRGFYSLEKIDYFSKEVLEEQVLKVLNKNKTLSYKKLKKHLHLTKEDNEFLLIALLKELEQTGKIFINNDYYKKMPDNYKSASVVDIWNGSYLLCKINNLDKVVKIPLNETKGALKYDTVIVSLNEKINKIEKIVKRQSPKIVCEVILEDNKKVLKPYHMVTNLKPRISSIDMANLVVGDLVLVNVSVDECDDYYEAEYLKNVGNINDPAIDLKCIALDYGFNEEFSEEANLEAKKIPTEVLESDLENRVDLRNKVIFTIDDITCKDMDDAISLEVLENGNFKLGVHIADVSHYINIGSILFEEAKNRGTSLYMINTSIPMLPRILTNGILSLNPGVDRLTMSCEMIIDATGKVLDYKIFDSVINSKKKMSYQEVNKVIKGNPSIDYKPFEKNILEMQKLSLILNKKKQERGYLDFASLESKFLEDENGKITSIIKRSQDDAEKIIENFMVLANETVDMHMFWLGLPKMARTHEEPDEERLKNTVEVLKMAGYKIEIDSKDTLSNQIPEILNSLRSYEEFPILSNMILKCMARASYTTNTIGHFGLKLDRYMHFTSPIRRFPDLETHALLKMYHSKNLENIDLDNLAINLKQDADYSSKRERMADSAEEEAIALKNIEFYEGKIGKEVVGNITGVTYKRLLIQTNDLVNGIVKIDDIRTSNLGVHGNRSLDYRMKVDNLKIGSKVLLEIKEIDKDEKVIHFILKKNLSWKKDKEMTLTRTIK